MVCPSTLLVKKLNIRENSVFWKGYVVKSLLKLKIQSGGGYSLSNAIFTCREAARSCRSVGWKYIINKRDFETLKPLFLVLFGIIFSSFETVWKLLQFFEFSMQFLDI